MAPYTVGQLADLAGVSVRTLHHYDEIGLLAPAARTPGGYRLYGRRELLRLQQILLYRELSLDLPSIKAILDDDSFDPLEALQEHKHRLELERGRLARLLNTVDSTIRSLREGNMTLSDSELYAGLTPEEAERYRREAGEKYGEGQVREVEDRLRNLSQAEWKAIGEQGDQVTQELTDLMTLTPQDARVQAAIAKHYAWIGNFYSAGPERYRGLAEMYVENPEFRAFYERYRPGLAEFMRDAMLEYAEQTLA